MLKTNRESIEGPLFYQNNFPQVKLIEIVLKKYTIFEI